ncbi:MAG TPA: DNA polymerase III subunit alpha [bacterium]|nr:DNA polymerase III subunit alpha [bacterium]
MKFVHLHCHSHYSLLDGMAKIDELIEKAKEFEMPALAITDHGVMYGAIEFYQKAKEANIKPIIGFEAYLTPLGRHQKIKADEKKYHLTLLAKNFEGYQNLVKLCSLAHLEGFYYKPRIDDELLKKYHQGIICLSGCLQGEIPQLILAKKFDLAKKKILFYKEIFGDDFYLEIMPFGKIKDQIKVNQALIELSKELKVPLVATCDVHYLSPEDAQAHEVLLAIQTKSLLSDKNRLSMKDDDFSFKSPKQVIEFFKDVPEAIENTLKIASLCNLELELGKVQMPKIKIEEGFDSFSYLKKLAQEGLRKRYPQISPQIKDRFNYELEVIRKTGFADYFLIVADIVNWAKKEGIVVGPGRGSAAGSLISYCLGITDFDPIKYSLLFERFLNPERVSMPDIDIDFDDRRRDEVIEYTKRKFGEDHVARIITFGTMAARPAIRDVGRVLGVPYNFCDRLAKTIPQNLSIEEALKVSPEFHHYYSTDRRAFEIVELAKKIEGVARHASVHACGVAIAPFPLMEKIPLQRAPQDPETVITQYEMKSIEALGILKMDFLGLRNLTIIVDTLKNVERTEKKKIEIKKIPLNDQKTFKLLSEGKTVGVFQLESEGMQKTLKGVKPTQFEDLIAILALYRPGPAQLIPSYIRRKQGKEKIEYLHPKLEPILRSTYGVLIYQEQLMEIAKELAGFSLSEADILRKAVGKKIKELLEEQKEKLIKGMIERGIKKEVAQKIWEWILPFARYGFNKSHATGYALIAYWTAYLKAHFPYEFMAAVLNAEGSNVDKISFLLSECKRAQIKVLPPSINESFEDFRVVKIGNEKVIRFGLSAIKNVGKNLVEAIISEREKNGKFKSIEDFLQRIDHKDLNKKSLEALIKAGVFTGMEDRRVLLDNLDYLLDYLKNSKKSEKVSQPALFSLDLSKPKFELKRKREASLEEKLAWEKEFLGVFVSGHPLDLVESKILPRYKIADLYPLSDLSSPVEILGLVSEIKKVITKNGTQMLFVKVEDQTGSIEVIVFPDVLEKTFLLWQKNKILLIRGELTKKESEPKIICQSVESVK